MRFDRSFASRWRERTETLALQGPLGLVVRFSFVVSISAVLVVAGVMYPLRDIVDGAALSLLYVLLIFAIGIAFGPVVVATSAIVAFLVSDFLFYPPYLTLLLDKKHHLLGLLTFLAIAIP